MHEYRIFLNPYPSFFLNKIIIIPRKFLKPNLSNLPQFQEISPFKNTKPISHLFTLFRISKSAGESVALPKCWAHTHTHFFRSWPVTRNRSNLGTSDRVGPATHQLRCMTSSARAVAGMSAVRPDWYPATLYEKGQIFSEL